MNRGKRCWMYASEKSASDMRPQVPSRGRLIVTLAPAMFDFTTWSFHVAAKTA